jgi:hypothetical protein
MGRRCGCTGGAAGGCSCVFADSETITRSGAGTELSPFVFEAVGDGPDGPITIPDVEGLEAALVAAGLTFNYFAYAIAPATPVDGSATHVQLYNSGTTDALSGPVPVGTLAAGGAKVFRPGIADGKIYTVNAAPAAWTVFATIKGAATIYSILQNIAFVGTNLAAPGGFGTSPAANATSIVALAPFLPAITTALAPFSADLTSLTNKVFRALPTNPIGVYRHRTKWVTWDNAFPLDGSPTHVGGQRILDSTQRLTILTGTQGAGPGYARTSGGVRELKVGAAATEPGGLGAMLASEIGNYHEEVITGTDHAAECDFRLLGHPTLMGLEKVFGGFALSRHYRPTLIATEWDGADDLTILNKDGTTSVESIAAMPSYCFGVLVLDTSQYLTIDQALIVDPGDSTKRIIDGASPVAVQQIEDFSAAEGETFWTARGFSVSGDHAGTHVEYAGGEWVILSGEPVIDRTIIADDEIDDTDDVLAVDTDTAAADVAVGTTNFTQVGRTVIIDNLGSTDDVTVAGFTIPPGESLALYLSPSGFRAH